MHSPDYHPIDCGVHDRLESWAVRRTPVTVVFTDERGAEHERSGRIADVFARGGAEYVRLEDGTEVRLDRLRSVVAP